MNQLTREGGDNIPLAVAAIIFTVFALAFGDALIKQFSTSFTLWQIFVIRSALAVPVVIGVFKLWNRADSLIPGTVKWTAIRSLLLTFMWVTYYAALPHIPLSIAAAAYYTLPLFITLFAALFIGDRIGIKGWIAVCMGFLGILLILKPDSDGFNAYALLPIISAILYALAMVITRTKCRNENALVLSMALNVSMGSIGILATILLWVWGQDSVVISSDPFLLGHWETMGHSEWIAMGILATAIIVGSVGAAVAYQSGPPSIVGTFDFAYVAFAAGWGFILFDEVPDTSAIFGIALIVSAGILAVRR